MSEKIPIRFRDAKPESLLPAVLGRIEEWAGTKEAMLILGPTGSGKSWTAAAAWRAWKRRQTEDLAESRYVYNLSARWENVPELAREMRDIESSEEAHRRVTGCDLLVLDDLGAEKDGEWIAERIYAAVGHRYNWLKPTIVTTNLTAEAMSEAWPRLASRLLSGTVLELTGRDLRLVGQGA